MNVLRSLMCSYFAHNVVTDYDIFDTSGLRKHSLSELGRFKA